VFTFGLWVSESVLTGQRGVFFGFFPTYSRWLPARYWIGLRFVLYSMKWLFIPKELAVKAYYPSNLATAMLLRLFLKKSITHK
jgi:hypothetical protein